MKKLIVFFLVFCFPVFFLSARLIDVYKKGEIKLIPDPGFGENTDWGLYLNRSETITVAHDGSIFVLDWRNCIVSKFDEKGTFLLKFGQKGEGPGDLVMPLSISTLDEKYLVIGDSPLHRKISLFDLQGKIIKVIKTQYQVRKCVALKDDKIALLSKRTTFSTGNFTLVVLIKDINTLGEKIVTEVTDRIRMIREPGFVTPMQDLQNHGIIRRMPDGNLLVGFVYNNFVEIYNPGGKKVKTIDLKIDCDTALNFMEYDTPFIDTRFRGFVFRGNSFFLVLTTSEDDEVVKVVLK